MYVCVRVSVRPQGLFARRRQLLLTEGPHLYYVDPVNKVLKGEIPWSPELRPEAKNFKTFFVHTVKTNCFLNLVTPIHNICIKPMANGKAAVRDGKGRTVLSAQHGLDRGQAIHFTF